METSENYYLICEYGGDTNLAEYTKTAHQYISEKRLKLKDWRTVVKYIAWQLAVSLYWMHHDMKCAHLDLTMENIMIQHGEFMVDEQSGAVTINTSKLTARICMLSLLVFGVICLCSYWKTDSFYFLIFVYFTTPHFRRLWVR